MKKRTLIIVLTIQVAIALVTLGIIKFVSPVQANPISTQAAANLKHFTKSELANYNGTNPDLPIYLAMDGSVYDVTAGKEYYVPGGSYHDLAGTDASLMLHIAGGSIIKRKYTVIGVLDK